MLWASQAGGGDKLRTTLVSNSADLMIDVTGDICPMTYVRTRLALDRMQDGQILLVLLRGDEAARNVPASARAQGHVVLAETVMEGDVCAVSIRRRDAPLSIDNRGM